LHDAPDCINKFFVKVLDKRIFDVRAPHAHKGGIMSGLAYSTPVIGAPPPQAATNQLLASLPNDDLQRLRPHLRTVRLRAKQVLHKQGDRIREVYFPTGGAYSIIELMQDGQAAEIATVGAEGLLGGSVYFGQEESFTQSVVQVPGQWADVLTTEAFNAEMARKGALFIRTIQVLPGAHDAGHADHGVQRSSLGRAALLPLAAHVARSDPARRISSDARDIGDDAGRPAPDDYAYRRGAAARRAHPLPARLHEDPQPDRTGAVIVRVLPDDHRQGQASDAGLIAAVNPCGRIGGYD
jgi:hypothetical protein